MTVKWFGWKRVVDLTLVMVSLPLLLPLLVGLALWVKLDSKGPVFYRSQRLGRNGRLFTIIKYRTMYINSPPRHAADGSLLVVADDPRVTRAGRVLRLGLDELPQLWHVLTGDMSLIGPRADPPAAQASYQPVDYERMRVVPGITGLAQVKGRTRISLTHRRQWDQTYINHWSPALDAAILLLTVFEVVPALKRTLPAIYAWGDTVVDAAAHNRGHPVGLSTS